MMEPGKRNGNGRNVIFKLYNKPPTEARHWHGSESETDETEIRWQQHSVQQAKRKMERKLIGLSLRLVFHAACGCGLAGPEWNSILNRCVCIMYLLLFSQTSMRTRTSTVACGYECDYKN